MDLSVVVVSWNTRVLLRSCLQSVYGTVSGMQFEVVVVDNGSTDGSAEMVALEFPRATLIRNEANRGFAAANNQAIQMSTGRYVLLLNSDTRVYPDAIEDLVHLLDVQPSVGIVGAGLLNGNGTPQASWAEFPTIRSEITGKNFRKRSPLRWANASQVFEVDWVSGACLMARRAMIGQIGLLDEDFFMYSEEADWCFRARALGWVVCYYPGAQVMHLGGQSSRAAGTEMKAHLYRSKLLFFLKHYGRARTLALYLLLTVALRLKATMAACLSLVPWKGLEYARAVRDDSLVLARALAEYGQQRMGFCLSSRSMLAAKRVSLRKAGFLTPRTTDENRN